MTDDRRAPDIAEAYPLADDRLRALDGKDL